MSLLKPISRHMSVHALRQLLCNIITCTSSTSSSPLYSYLPYPCITYDTPLQSCMCTMQLELMGLSESSGRRHENGPAHHTENMTTWAWEPCHPPSWGLRVASFLCRLGARAMLCPFRGLLDITQLALLGYLPFHCSLSLLHFLFIS